MTGNDDSPQDPLAGLRDVLGDVLGVDGFDGEYPDIPAPTFWPAVPAVDAAVEWADLRDWVADLQARFETLDHHVIPRCWWRHNSHVEALAALRDHERSSFSDTAPSTAPVDYLRALRDVTSLLKTWTGDLGCATAHQPQPAPPTTVDADGWERHVTSDVARRRNREIQNAARPGDARPGDSR